MRYNSSMVDEILKVLATKNYYLVLIYDGEYNHYVTEILDPYGEIQSAGLGSTLDSSLEDVVDELAKKENLDEE